MKKKRDIHHAPFLQVPAGNIIEEKDAQDNDGYILVEVMRIWYDKKQTLVKDARSGMPSNNADIDHLLKLVQCTENFRNNCSLQKHSSHLEDV